MSNKLIKIICRLIALEEKDVFKSNSNVCSSIVIPSNCKQMRLFVAILMTMNYPN